MQIRIASFGGMQPNTDARLLPNGGAQIAHNCLLEDGSLQPMPQWVAIEDGPLSVSDPAAGAQYTAYTGYCGLTFYGPPFGRIAISLNASGLILPSVSSSATGSMYVSPSSLSKKAVNRVYGVTSLVVAGGVTYESDLTVLNSANPRQVMYEGDVATITMSGTGSALRLYRSTSDVTTGSGANGAMTANWQLVSQLNGSTATYADAGAATADPFDTYLYRGPTIQPFLAFRMGLLESGYVWLVSEDGNIALSDRFAWGYWPVENRYNLGNNQNDVGIVVTGTACVGDMLYIGTQQGAYACRAEVTEAGAVVLAVTLVPRAPPCLPNTMVATAGGAMYTSAQGVVGLDGGHATMLSQRYARGVFGYDPKGAALEFSTIGNAVYRGGRYYGVSGGLPPPLSLTGHLVNGYENTSVTYQYLSGGGTAPRTISLHSGTFPAGLSIDSAGIVTGKRTTAGLYTFELQIVDALGTIVYLNDTSQTISTDIVHWSTVDTGLHQSPTSSAAFLTNIIIACDNNFLELSDDSGQTWTTGSVSGFIRSTWVINFRGDWYLFGSQGENTASMAPGGVWPPVFTPFANAPYQAGVAIMNNTLYSGDTTNTGTFKLRKMSTPGSAWATTDTGVAVSVASAAISGVGFTGSSYILVTNNGDILRSVDLLYFTSQASGLGRLNFVAVLDGVVIVSGGSGDAYRSLDDGITWVAIGGAGKGFVVATPSMFISGNVYTIYTSVDGVAWTTIYVDNSGGQMSGKPCATPVMAVYPVLYSEAFVGTA